MVRIKSHNTKFTGNGQLCSCITSSALQTLLLKNMLSSKRQAPGKNFRCLRSLANALWSDHTLRTLTHYDCNFISFHLPCLHQPAESMGTGGSVVATVHRRDSTQCGIVEPKATGTDADSPQRPHSSFPALAENKKLQHLNILSYSPSCLGELRVQVILSRRS